MKTHLLVGGVLLFLLMVSIISSAIPQNYPKILSYTSEVLPDSYNFAFETEDGVRRSEKGEFVNGIWTVSGSVTWTDKEGVPRSYIFKADDKGVVLQPPPAPGVPGGIKLRLNPSTIGSLIG